MLLSTILAPVIFSQELPKANLTDQVWQYRVNNFDQISYTTAVEALIQQWESQAGQLAPGETGKVGLNLYVDSGPGLMTPPKLVAAVAMALERRGFARQNIVLFGSDRRLLKSCGYLPWSTRKPQSYKGMPVQVVGNEGQLDAQWYYESNLPSRNRTLSIASDSPIDFNANIDDRKSFLPFALMFDVDFWINLPMVTDSEAFGVIGAMTNASVDIVSNNERFYSSSSIGPVAVAEITAIPELYQTYAFTIQTLERYQFMGSRQFNSLYTASEPVIWLSQNPVALDYFNWRRIAWLKRDSGFRVKETVPAMFHYGQSIGLGEFDSNQLTLMDISQ